MEQVGQLKKIAFVGGGAMAEAIINGLVAAKLVNPKTIWVGAHRQEHCEHLANTYGVCTTIDNCEAVKDAELVVLAIKPQMVASALDARLVAALAPKATLLSIMGSVDIARLQGIFPGHGVIRTMPNTPLAVGMGMTAIAPAEGTEEAMVEAAKEIFGSCGEIVMCSEGQIEAITAMSGCGPGYAFVLIDALADAGVNAGLPRAMAIKLAAQTFAGSGKMVLETGKHPAQLRDMVTSPGGTTIAGIHALESHGVRAAMYDAVMAVLARSEKLKGN